MAHFFWGGMDNHHKYHLFSWGMISREKEFGGLGVPIIREFNMALLANWAKRYFDSKDNEWKKVISYKYDISERNILWSKNGAGSIFWKSDTWAFAAAKNFYKWKLGNGEKTSFWHDTWVGVYSLKTQFWDLFGMV